MKKLGMNTPLSAALFAGTIVALGGCAGAGAGGASMMMIGAALSILLTLAGCSTSHSGDGDGGTGVDNDGDGYGDDVDCNDENASIHPGAYEQCTEGCDSYGDGIDNNCDGRIDEPEACAISNCFPFEDADGDGWDVTQDCDDTDPNVNPGAAEFCTQICDGPSGDGIDNNCDGRIDEPEACLIANCFPMDLDYDGWAEPDDCNDEDPAIHPGAEETCCDGVDSDCDGIDDPVDVACNCFYDDDGDGYGDGFGPGPDCDDTDPTIHPGAEDLVCDGIDQDCDGEDNTGGLPACEG